MARLKFGYVGGGQMGQGVHIPNFSRIPEVELVGLAETRPKLGERVQRKWGFRKLYQNHTELADDPEIEAVGVSAGMSAQGEIARDLARAGKHVFMEKPMAISLAQAEEMLEDSRAGGGRVMVAYMKRYDAGNEIAHRHLQEFYETRSMGAPFFARAHSFCGDWEAGYDWNMERTDEPYPVAREERWPDWLPAEMREEYVGFLQEWTHNLNLLRWFLDAGDDAQVRYVDLTSCTAAWGAYCIGSIGFRMKGIRAVLESGILSYHGYDEHTQVYFPEGWVKVSSPPLLLKNLPAQVEIYRGGEPRSFQYPVAPFSWSYQREAEHFVECLQTGQPFRSSAEDTFTDVRLFEEIFRLRVKELRSR